MFERLRSAVILAAFALGGCTGGVLGLEGAPVVTTQPDRAVAEVQSVMNNIKCDLLLFMRDNDKLTEAGHEFGGTLTFTVDRAKSIGFDASIGVPIVSGVKITAGGGKSKKVSFGEVISLPFVVSFDPKQAQVACLEAGQDPATGTRKIAVVRPGSSRPTDETLNAPILGAALLRRQLSSIRPGQPQITLAAITFKGSVVLTQNTNGHLGINVLSIADVSGKGAVDTDYKIDYEIGSNWRSILKEAKFDVADAPSKPTVVADPNAVPPAKHEGKPGAHTRQTASNSTSPVLIPDGPYSPLLAPIVLSPQVIDRLTHLDDKPKEPAMKPQ